MNNCIAGFGKVKTAAELTALSNHNNRINLTVNEQRRIDSKRTALNTVLINPLNISSKKAGDMNAKINEFYKSENIEVKKDSVLAIDLMITASPEFFGDWHKDAKLKPESKIKIDGWVQTQLDFVKKEFGVDAIKYAVLHLDETSPHIHFLITPEQTKIKTLKNQHGESEKKVTILNAKRWNPKFWISLVTRLALANAKHGLKRGQEKSLARNVNLKEFAAKVAAAANTDYEKAVTQFIADSTNELGMLTTKEGVKKLLLEKLVPKLNGLFKNNKALKELLKLGKGQEYKLIKQMQDDLQKKILEAETKAEYYGKGLKIRMGLEEELAGERAKNKALSLENAELKARVTPSMQPANFPTYKNKA